MAYINFSFEKVVPMKKNGLLLILLFAAAPAFASPGATAPPVNTKPKNPAQLVSQRIFQQMSQVQREVKAGKLTKEQGAGLEAQLKTIRSQQVADLKQNGNHQLTQAQISQLNSQLDGTSRNIPIH